MKTRSCATQHLSTGQNSAFRQMKHREATTGIVHAEKEQPVHYSNVLHHGTGGINDDRIFTIKRTATFTPILIVDSSRI